MDHIALQDYLGQIEGLLDENRLEEAAAHCYFILRQHPRHVATYRLFGRVLLEQHNYRDAIDMFQRVLSADPEDLIAHAGLAEAHREMEDLPRSIWHMERAFEIQPYNRAVQLELGTLYEQRDGSAPEQVALTRAALARLYVQGGHYRLAADELQSLLIDQSERVDLRVLLAEALYWDGRRLEAARVCADILDELPDCIKANAILAEVWLSGGREPEARPFTEHLWALTLIERSQRDTESLVGRALSYGEHAPPDQIMVEQLEYVHTAVEEPVVNWEGASAFAAVAVQELPGWLDELDDESFAFDESDAGSTVVEETDWSHQLSVEQEIMESLETTTKETLTETEGAETDSRETRFEEAMPEFSAPEAVEDQELPGQVESISAATALLLENETDDDRVLPSEKDMSDGLRDETVDENEPIEPAEALMGEFNAAREEAQTREPEQPVEGILSEDAAAEEFDMEGLWQAAGDQVEDNALTPQDAVPLEPEHSPEDLFLESIVAEAFGQMTPPEPPVREPAELVADEDGMSTFDSEYPQDDIFLEEIAAEAFEEEIAPESFSELSPREAPIAGPVGTLEEPILERRATEAIDEEALPVPDDEGRGGADPLFAALAARQIAGHQREELQEEPDAVDAGEVERQKHPDVVDEEPEQLADHFEIGPAETSLEDNIFESLGAEADHAAEHLDLDDKVTKEFDVAPEEIAHPVSEARPEAAVFGALAAEVTDKDAFREPTEEIEESPNAAPEALVAPENEIRQRDDSFETWAEDASDEFRLPEYDSFEADEAEAAAEVVILGPSDIVTKEFDVLPDALLDPSEFAAGDSASEEENIIVTAAESQIQDAELKEFDLAPGEMPPGKLPGHDMPAELPEIEAAAALPPAESFDSTEVYGDDSVSDWLDDLSEETSDVENLPDWLYDAIGFTGELEMPDDYEDPDWLSELGADVEETVRESKPVAGADDVKHRGPDTQDTSQGIFEAPTAGKAGAGAEQEIPDWLEGTGNSLEELPTDLVENMGISGSEVADEDEGALRWLEELAAEPPSVDDEKGTGKSGVLDRFIKKRPNQPDEPADGAGADSD